MSRTFSCANCALGPPTITGCDKCYRDGRYKDWKHKEFKGDFPLILDHKIRADFFWTPTHVPWALVLPYEEQAKANHSQTLLELAKRGGLCPTELLAIIEQRSWTKMPIARAHKIIQILTEELCNS